MEQVHLPPGGGSAPLPPPPSNRNRTCLPEPTDLEKCPMNLGLWQGEGHCPWQTGRFVPIFPTAWPGGRLYCPRHVPRSACSREAGSVWSQAAETTRGLGVCPCKSMDLFQTPLRPVLVSASDNPGSRDSVYRSACSWKAAAVLSGDGGGDGGTGAALCKHGDLLPLSAVATTALAHSPHRALLPKAD